MSDPENTISFQGMRGAYSMAACRAAYPDMEPLPCRTFTDAFEAVETGKAALAMIPIDNSVAGRVADIHHLLPESGLHIVAEHFQHWFGQAVSHDRCRRHAVLLMRCRCGFCLNPPTGIVVSRRSAVIKGLVRVGSATADCNCTA